MRFEDQKTGFKCPQCSAPRRRFAKKVGDKIGVTNDGGDAPILVFSIVGGLAVIGFGIYAALSGVGGSRSTREDVAVCLFFLFFWLDYFFPRYRPRGYEDYRVDRGNLSSCLPFLTCWIVIGPGDFPQCTPGRVRLTATLPSPLLTLADLNLNAPLNSKRALRRPPAGIYKSLWKEKGQGSTRGERTWQARKMARTPARRLE